MACICTLTITAACSGVTLSAPESRTLGAALRLQSVIPRPDMRLRFYFSTDAAVMAPVLSTGMLVRLYPAWMVAKVATLLSDLFPGSSHHHSNNLGSYEPPNL